MQTIKEDDFKDLLRAMVYWRGLAHKNYLQVKEVQKTYRDKYESGRSRFASVADADLAAATDPRFLGAVSNNQMYDRFAQRDAALVTALLKARNEGFLVIVP